MKRQRRVSKSLRLYPGPVFARGIRKGAFASLDFGVKDEALGEGAAGSVVLATAFVAPMEEGELQDREEGIPVAVKQFNGNRPMVLETVVAEYLHWVLGWEGADPVMKRAQTLLLRFLQSIVMPRQAVVDEGEFKLVSLSGASQRVPSLCHRISAAFMLGPDTAALRGGLLDVLGAQVALQACGVHQNDYRLSNTVLSNTNNFDDLIAGRRHGERLGPRFAVIDFASAEFTGATGGLVSRMCGFPTCTHTADTVAFPFLCKHAEWTAAASVGFMMVHLMAGTEVSTLCPFLMDKCVIEASNVFLPQHLCQKLLVSSRFGGVRPRNEQHREGHLDEVAAGVLLSCPMVLYNWATCEVLHDQGLPLPGDVDIAVVRKDNSDFLAMVAGLVDPERQFNAALCNSSDPLAKETQGMRPLESALESPFFLAGV